MEKNWEASKKLGGDGWESLRKFGGRRMGKLENFWVDCGGNGWESWKKFGGEIKKKETVALERKKNEEFWYNFCENWLRSDVGMGCGSFGGWWW